MISSDHTDMTATVRLSSRSSKFQVVFSVTVLTTVTGPMVASAFGRSHARAAVMTARLGSKLRGEWGTPCRIHQWSSDRCLPKAGFKHSLPRLES